MYSILMDVFLSTILKNSHYSNTSNRQTECKHDNNWMASSYIWFLKWYPQLKSTILAKNTFNQIVSLNCGSYVFK